MFQTTTQPLEVYIGLLIMGHEETTAKVLLRSMSGGPKPRSTEAEKAAKPISQSSKKTLFHKKHVADIATA